MYLKSRVLSLLSFILIPLLFSCDDEDELEPKNEKLTYIIAGEPGIGGKIDTLWAYEYDDEGKLSKILDGPISSPSRYEQFVYGSNNWLLEKKTYSRNSVSNEYLLGNTITYTYLSDGKLTKEVITNPSSTRPDKVSSFIEYQYNGNLLEKTEEYTTSAWWLPTPQLQRSILYEYNQADKKTKESFFSPNSTTSHAFIEYYYTDTLLTKAIDYSGSKEAGSTYTPLGETIWTYDSKNRIESERFTRLQFYIARGNYFYKYIYK